MGPQLGGLEKNWARSNCIILTDFLYAEISEQNGKEL
jgi:hypothetical protein